MDEPRSEHALPRVLHAPWSQEVVDALVAYQESGQVHPYTCLHDHRVKDRVLVPTRMGWECPTCDYRQSWVGAETITRAQQFASDGASDG